MWKKVSPSIIVWGTEGIKRCSMFTEGGFLTETGPWTKPNYIPGPNKEPEGSLYSWKTLKGDKKGHLDYLLVTPKLLEHITRANHIYLGKDITDHSSLNFDINIEKQEKGKGIFHANPSLLKHPNYVTLIHNIIYNDILEAIEKIHPTCTTRPEMFSWN